MVRFKNKTVILFIALFTCAVLIALAHFQYFSTREQIIQLHSEKQIILAEQVALSIEKFFDERVRAMEFLAESATLKDIATSNYQAMIKRVYEKIGSYELIGFVDREGQIIQSYQDNPGSFDYVSEEVRSSIVDAIINTEGKKTPSVYSISTKIDSQSATIIEVPLYTTEETFNGVFIGLLSLHKSLKNIIEPVLTLPNVQTFILSERGHIIYHPSHPEMLYSSINEDTQNCLNCHKDFTAERRMLQKTSGWGLKTAKDGTRKLLAFGRINLPSEYWSLAIDTPYNIVTASVTRQFWMFFILTASIIVIVIIGTTSLYRINKERLEIEKESQFFKARSKLLENVEEAEAKYRGLVEQSPDAIAIVQKQRFVFANEKFLKLFGFSFSQISDEKFTFSELVREESKENLDEVLRRLTQERLNLVVLSLQGKTKENKTLDLELSIGRFILGGKIAYQIVVHDVTEMKQKERESAQREHLAFIGEMSTRIAHEIKNPLASLQAGIQLIESRLPEDQNTRDYFKRLRGEVQRVDGIVKGLLSYAKKEQLHLKKVDMSTIVKQVIDFIGHSINKNDIELKYRIEPGNTTVQADPQKIEQVLWNLLINSVQSIRGQGIVEIEIHDTPNEHLQLMIRDTGKGIPPENMDKIFQPFFSTKSQGTGLGLSISKKIITAHQGKIAIESTVSQGTQVFITLPR